MADEKNTEDTAVAGPDIANMDAQQLAAAIPPEELARLKESLKKGNGQDVIPGRFIANCPGQQGIHVKAADRPAAVALVCLYLGCEASEVVVSAVKRSAGPRKGERVLRAHPVAGNPDAIGFAYGIEPPEEAAK